VTDALLTAATVVDYLRGRGVLSAAEPAEASELAGGVSSVALLVRGSSRAVVVKQALPKLRVEADWRASRRRTLTEAAALRAYGRLTPGAVPAVVDVDEDVLAVTMEALPERMRCWKPLLLAGEVDDGVGALLGATLARWHARTAEDEKLRERFADREVFLALRVEPFYGAVAERHPELASAVESTVARMLSDRTALVHGDFSPKNVLVAPERAVVLDCEVAHEGDPSFDVAFMLHHLALKAVARPRAAGALHACARRFLDAYDSTAAFRGDRDHLVRQTACLMLARVDGTSPVDYLDADARDRVRRLGRRALLADPVPPLEDMWPGNGAHA